MSWTKWSSKAKMENQVCSLFSVKSSVIWTFKLSDSNMELSVCYKGDWTWNVFQLNWICKRCLVWSYIGKLMNLPFKCHMSSLPLLCIKIESGHQITFWLNSGHVWKKVGFSNSFSEELIISKYVLKLLREFVQPSQKLENWY